MLEDLLEEIAATKDVESGLGKCFTDILNNKELSYYKGALWVFKVNLLQLKQYEIGTNINNLELNFNNDIKKITILRIILYLLSIIMFFTYWPVGLLSFVYAIVNTRNINNNLVYIQNAFNESRDLLAKCDRIAQNCHTFIGKEMEVSAKRFNEQINNKEIIDLEPYYYAQNLIDLYINFGELMDTTPEIKDIVVKMLQSDLETEESNFMTLLDIAKEKVSEEKIQERKEKSNELYQKYAESCRKLQKFYNKKRKSGR